MQLARKSPSSRAPGGAEEISAPRLVQSTVGPGERTGARQGHVAAAERTGQEVTAC